MVLCLFAGLALACGSSGSGTATPSPELTPVTLSGRGDSVLSVRQYAAYGKAQFTHDGKAHFTTTSHDSAGNVRKSLVDEFGRCNGTVIWDREAAYLQVKADGSWAIELTR